MLRRVARADGEPLAPNSDRRDGRPMDTGETIRVCLGYPALDTPEIHERLRQIALWKLEGRTNQEIAVSLGYQSVRTVERKLRLIRGKWKASDPSEA